jgi:hypothetical protein
MYKIISKVLANRFKSVMGKIISNTQNAFIGGQQILDSALIAMNAWIVKFDRGNLGYCVSWIWKKAYDHVNWDFLLYLLHRCGFGEKWRAWMRFCISVVRFSTLVNGTPSGFFNSTCGLRLRDPLSPLLFVVVMEALSRMLIAVMD